MKEQRFIIRVYGIYIDPLQGLFVSDEKIREKNITKFPGGGLEYGEGTINCLQREMIEETGSEFEITSHFYTTDYFVESAFDPEWQIISIYYIMKPLQVLQIEIPKISFNFKNDSEGSQSFRFIPFANVNAEQFTLSIDRHVASLLVRRINNF